MKKACGSSQEVILSFFVCVHFFIWTLLAFGHYFKVEPRRLKLFNFEMGLLLAYCTVVKNTRNRQEKKMPFKNKNNFLRIFILK